MLRDTFLNDVLHQLITKRPTSKSRSSGQRRNGPVPFTESGELQYGSESDFALNGKDLMIDASTWIFGELERGARVLVEGVYRPGGVRYAKKVVVRPPRGD